MDNKDFFKDHWKSFIQQMLQLFIISFYLKGTSKTFFKKFPKYEYGFNENATYNIDLSNSFYKHIIFGMATKKEMKYIKSVQNNYEFCDGKHQLSQVQEIIYQTNRITGSIQSKRILTPYVFTCDKEYSLEVTVNFLNGENNLDYRYQKACNILVFFQLFIIQCFITSCFLISSAYGLGYSFFLFIILFYKVTSTNILASAIEGNEYFDFNYDKELKSYVLTYKIIVIVMFIIISCYYLGSLKDRIKNINVKFQLLLYIYNIAFVVIIFTVLIFFVKKLFVAILFCVFYAIFIVNQSITIFTHKFSLETLGLLIFYISLFIDLPLTGALLNTKNITSNENILAKIIIISCVFYSLVYLLIIIKMRYSLTHKEKDAADSGPLLIRQNDDTGTNINSYVEYPTMNSIDANEEKNN